MFLGGYGFNILFVLNKFFGFSRSICFKEDRFVGWGFYMGYRDSGAGERLWGIEL